MKVISLLGSILIIFGFYSLAEENPLWWYYFTTGGFLFLTVENTRNGNNNSFLALFKRDKKKFLKIYFVCTLWGIIVEAIRITPNLWKYTEPFNKPWIVLITIFIFYFLFLAFIYETYIWLVQKTKKTQLSFVLAIVFAFLWCEISNKLVPFWIVEKDKLILVYSLYLIGYISEILVPIITFKLIKE